MPFIGPEDRRPARSRRIVLQITVWGLDVDDGTAAIDATVDVGAPMDGIDGTLVSRALHALSDGLGSELDAVWEPYRRAASDVLNPN